MPIMEASAMHMMSHGYGKTLSTSGGNVPRNTGEVVVKRAKCVLRDHIPCGESQQDTILGLDPHVCAPMRFKLVPLSPIATANNESYVE